MAAETIFHSLNKQFGDEQITGTVKVKRIWSWRGEMLATPEGTKLNQIYSNLTNIYDTIYI